MAGSGSSEVRTPIFSGENYEFWRIKMVTIFTSYGLWNVVEKGIPILDSKKKKTTEQASEDDDDGKMAAIFMTDAKTLGIIQNVVSDQIFPRIANADSAKMAWELLYGEYHDSDHVRSMKTFGETLSNERLVQKVLISLSKSQEQQFELHNVDTAEKAFALFSVSPKGLNKGGTQSSSSKFQKNWNPKGKPWESKSKHKGKPKCYNCDRFGHWARECTASKNVQKAKCANQVEVIGNLFYVNSTISGASANGEWYIDSGCSNHMIGNKKLLVDIRTNVIGKVQMPTRKLMDVAGMGTLVIDTSKGRKHIKKINVPTWVEGKLAECGTDG
ncbi:uncharacterized protein LOC109948689 [Prunus persica]|uniref:uncharacterized protein LOC109948689 n=1 Tax=Prunus persica TaxID=3760 RepID=UPI0009AB5957|nr:uncharacterized protein LOC109948689 [Prunus persica]